MTTLALVPQTTRICTKCGDEKILDEFRKHPSKKDGRETQCKKCHAQSTTLWLAEQSPFYQTNHKYHCDFEAMWQEQKGLCAMCGETLGPPGRGSRAAHVDHDHACCPGYGSCGRCVRGIIHSGCNRLLGHSNENIHRLQSAIAYLEKHRG